MKVYKFRLNKFNSFLLHILFGIFFAFGLGNSLGRFSCQKVGSVSVEFEFGNDTLGRLDGNHDGLS